MALNAPSTSPDAGGRPGHRPLDDLWRAVSSPIATIVLATLLAGTFAVAALIPQLPVGLDLTATAQWLATTAALYGRTGALLGSSGLLNVLGSPWMTLLLAAMAFHLALRIAGQVRHLQRTRRVDAPLAPQGLPFELVQLPDSLGEIRDRVAPIMAAERMAATVQETETAAAPKRVDAFGRRRTASDAGPLLAALGVLLMTGGLLWNSVGGWRAVDMALTPGSTVQPAQARGLSLSLINSAGSGESGPSFLQLTHAGSERIVAIDTAWPARWGSVWVAQRSSGPALSVRARAGGEELPLQSLQAGGETAISLHLRFGQDESEQGFAIPSQNMAFRVVSYESLPEQDVTAPVFLIEGYHGEDAAAQLNRLVEEEATIEWEGITLSLQRDRFVVVDLAGMPGLPLLLAGAVLLLAGVALSAWWGPSRVWINAIEEGSGALVAVRAAAPAGGQGDVARWIARLAVGAPEPELPTAELPESGRPGGELG